MSNQPKSLYLICGDDEYQLWSTARALIDQLVPEDQRDFGLEIIDGRVDSKDDTLALFGRCEEALLTDSLFGGGDKLVWLREPSFLSNERHARLNDIKQRLTHFTNRIKEGFPDGKRLLITTAKINRATALFKTAKAQGEVVDFGNNLKPREYETRARKFLDERLGAGTLDMSAALRAQFISRVGTDARLIASELDKLASYCGTRREVTSDDIEQIVSGGGASEVWPLLDAFGNRSCREALRHLRVQLAQSESPIKLAAMLEGRLADLIQLREALDRKWASAGGYQGVSWREIPPEVERWFGGQERGMRSWHSFRLQSLAAQVSRWKLRELRLARHHMLEMREKLVSSSLSPEWLLEIGLVQALR